MGNKCTKFQVDWTSTSSKTTLTKNFNLKRTDERRHRPENIMPLYYRRWGIKIKNLHTQLDLAYRRTPIIQFLMKSNSLILDPDLDQFENWANNQKSKYILRFSISKNPQDSIFVRIKLSLILDPLDLNVDQFENGTKN